MLQKFYIKYFLFVLVLLLITLIIHTKNNKVILDLTVWEDDDRPVQKSLISDEFLVYVANEDQIIFPLNVNVSRNLSYELNGYEEVVQTETDQKMYYTFSLLTNNSNYLPQGVQTLVPRSTKLLSYKLSDNYLTLNVSNDFLYYNRNHEKKMMSLLTYTFTEMFGVDYFRIKAEDRIIDFDHYTNNWFTKDQFVLNSYLTSGSHQGFDTYLIYYYIDVENELYLAPVSIADETSTNKPERIRYYLSHIIGLPVMTFYEEDSEAAYAQYYLSMKSNGFMGNTDEPVDLLEINVYEVVFY